MRVERSRGFPYFVAVLLVSAAALAASQRENGAGVTGESSEVLTGDFTCGVDLSDGRLFSYYSFQATGDIFPRSPYYGGFWQGDQPADDCDHLFLPASQIPLEHGCTVGPVAYSEDETGRSRSFAYVCHGPRSALISFVAAFTSAQLTASP